MAKRIFLSYCHKQGEWVWERLVPCLKAGGAETLIDRERLEAGKAVIGQMDSTQDHAEMSILVLSPDYLASPYCLHEMKRAIAQDPQFQNGKTIPLIRTACKLPRALKKGNQPLMVNLKNDRKSSEWDILLGACDANLGVPAPKWLTARDAIVQHLSRNESVNLVVTGQPKWRQLIQHFKQDCALDLCTVDLESGATNSRRGLVSELLKACGCRTIVPPEPEDLVQLTRTLKSRPITRIAIEHFDLVAFRPYYEVNLFSALRNLIMDERRLVLLIQSRVHFSALLPQDHPLSPIDLKTVELGG